MSIERARILVIDDDEAARYTVARTLRADGHEIAEGATGMQALEAARSWQPDLMVLDVRLPDIIGYKVAEQLKADPATQSMAILQVSASFTAADAQAEGLQRGADAYLTHPIDPGVLSATVQALLRMRRAEQREKEARERAEASERKYRFLADVVPHMVWSTDDQGSIDYYNWRWLEFAGLDVAQNEPLDSQPSLHPEDRERFMEAWERSLVTGEGLEIECRRWSPPLGAFRWLLVRALPMRDSDGKIVRWFGTSTDIEAQKQALIERERLLAEAHDLAAERERLVSELREEARRRNDFLAMLSHELRNPLTPIRNSIYLLERAPPGGDQAARARAVIERQTQHMARLIDDLLDATRIARGKVRLQRERLELNGLVQRAVEDHHEQFRRAGIEVEVSVPPEPTVVDGDPTRLAQVIGNILQNAVKFTPEGGRVSISLEVRDRAVIKIEDTGTGIGEETLGSVFEPFVQAESTLERSHGGLGLGLALARGIVDLHGGSISADSCGQGRGATFTVTLPLEVRPGACAATLPSSESGRSRRILVIEDNRDSAQSLKDALELSSHRVDVAHDGAEGLAKARILKPDVLLCDIGLPELDGYQVARIIRQDPELRSTFLVALSGYALQEDLDRASEAGFDRYMAKPPKLEELERLLAEVGEHARRLPEPCS